MMKRLIAMALVICTLFSLVACTPSLVVETLTGEGGGTLLDTLTETVEDNSPLVIPAGYCAGYSRVNITPSSFPFDIGADSYAKRVMHDVYLSCVAISDGDEVAFLIHMDLKSCSRSLFESMTRVIEQETGVTADHVFLTATHSHNAPSTGGNGYSVTWLRTTFYPQLRKMVKQAYRDLAPAEAYLGTADTTGYAHVRRYICEDGTVDGIHIAFKSGSPIVAHESLADPELQVIQFKRSGDKKDIVMVNWQAHAAHAHNTDNEVITSDFIHYLRQDTEKLTGAHFAYYNGACGNINLSSKISGLQKYTWKTVGQALALKVREAMNSAEKAQMGEIKVAVGGSEEKYRTVDPQRVAEAKICNEGTDAEKASNRTKYKFQSKYEVKAIVTLSQYTTEETTIPLSAIACGDFAFAAASYEMFDTNGQEVKTGSPYKMTFMCSCTNGGYGYIPSAFSYGQGGYEVYTCKFEAGVGERCSAELIRLLKNVA